jgi:trk system potassium uptake protein TrkH
MHGESLRLPASPTQQGFLLATAPAPLLVLGTQCTGLHAGLASGLALAQLCGALLLGRRPLAARLLVSGAILGTGFLVGWRAARQPLGALGTVVAVLGLLTWVWGWTLPSARPAGPRQIVGGSVAGAALVCLAGLVLDLAGPWTWLVPGLAVLVVAVVVPLSGAVAADRPTPERAFRWSDFVFASPARALALTFLALVAVGTLLLLLPLSSAGASMKLVDALFTATSATCVTGLIVRDTPRALSLFGQGVVLSLIQIGGLGIMIFSVAALAITGRRLSLRQESAALELVGTRDRSRVTDAARTVLTVTFLAEGAGALALAALFLLAGDPIGGALWRGVFTSISAFCNAGFALQSASLVPYQHEVGVVLVVAVLVVLGGLGPPVVQALPRWVRRQPLPLHARLVIWTTMVLAFPPALLLLAVEWGNTLRGMGPGARVANALFLAVTPRTAGFNSVATAAVKPATLWITMVLMFLGGSPGSTAGGIKTTTVALLTLVILAALRGRTHVRAFGFRVSQRSVYRAAAVTVLALLTMGTVVVVLQLTQEMPLDMAAFESLSALGTVGLSIGGTERLDAVGKLIVGVTMFTGRVGPLTLFMFLSARTASDRFELPEEEVAVG